MAFEAERIVNEHILRTRTPDGRDLLFMTGTAWFEFKGEGSNWKDDTVLIPIGPLWRRIDDVAPIAALGIINNQEYAKDAGWSTRATTWEKHNDRIRLVVDISIRDIDGYLRGVPYQATALGLVGG